MVLSLDAVQVLLNHNDLDTGPFPVNYDEKNWNLLAQFLQTPNRDKIPVNTRAKLLHDAWNLAYAGDLNFGVALNMTLFLKYEREFLAWNPIFSMIDHIGRHIDSSSVHKKFQVRLQNNIVFILFKLRLVYLDLREDIADSSL